MMVVMRLCGRCGGGDDDDDNGRDKGGCRW